MNTDDGQLAAEISDPQYHRRRCRPTVLSVTGGPPLLLVAGFLAHRLLR